MRKIKSPTSYRPGPRADIGVMGDSLSDGGAFVTGGKCWPALLQASLRDLGCPVRVLNHAVSGNNTGATASNMRYRFAEMTRVRVPLMGIIFGGVNDPGGGINQAGTQANLEWMGQTLLDAGARYLLIVSPQFLNYTVGGEATSQSKPGGAYTAVYDAQVAAVAALAAANPTKHVAFCDLWDYLRDLIATGAETLHSGAASWHIENTNQHFNAKGQRYVRDAVLATIQAQTGWLAALRAA